MTINKPSDNQAKKLADKTNQLIGEVRTNNKKLFESVSNAYIKLKSNKEALKAYKENVHCDRSSINKIIKISESDIIMKFITELPMSWSTLHQLSLIEDKQLIHAIDNKTVTVSSKLKDVKELRARLTGKISGQNASARSSKRTVVDISSYTPNTMRVDYSLIDQKSRSEVTSLVEKLKKYGFEIKISTDYIQSVA